MKRFILVAVFLAGFVFPRSAFAAAPTVTTITNSGTAVGEYQKYEITFQISQTFPAGSFLPYYYYDAADTPSAYPGRNSPYGVDGISVDAHFTSPSGKQIVVPAFYYQDYVRTKNGSGLEVMTAGTNYSWKVRFAPEELGTYSYFITIQTKDGQSQSGNYSFASQASNSFGFVRRSTRNPAFFEYSNGKTFLPIAGGRQWWADDTRSYDYEKTFALFAQNGINMTRVWTQNDGYGLTIEGHFDHYSWPNDFNPTDAVAIATPKGTQINQRGATEFDYIVQAAESAGVYMEVSAHDDPYWIWDASVYNETWNPTPVAQDDPIHLNYWKRNYRYRVARWGYSTSVLSWENVNEFGNIPVGSAVDNFNQAINGYMGQIDPWHHLRTTSQGSQAWSPAFWATATNDVTNYHDYLMSSRYSAGLWDDEVNFVYRFAQCLRKPATGCQMGDGSIWGNPNINPKPIIWGELDTGTANWNEANPSYRADHNMVWAGLFSPLAGTGVDWYWNVKTYLPQIYNDKKIARNFFSDIDYIGENFSYFSTSDVAVNSNLIISDQAKIRGLVLRSASSQKAYIWAQNKDYTWGKQTTTPVAVSGNLTLGGMTPGSYVATYWDTYTGATTANNLTVGSDGKLIVPITNLDKDVAVKIISTTAASPTPTTAPKIGDLNGDGKVDGSDLLLLISNWFSGGCTGHVCDLNNDQKINAMDAAVVIANFGK